MLVGRDADEALVGEVLGRARAGHSAVLVLLGDPGIGKTALLEQAAVTAPGMTVLRCAGVETEAEVPFAALHQLLRPALDRVAALPVVQAAALRAALGTGPAAGGDQLLVGVAVLSLLAELAEDRPVLCVVDDAHWLDRASAQALRFVARRLQAEAVAVLFGARDEFDPAGLASHRLGGLDPSAAERLVEASTPGLPEAVRRRVVAESAGNPLALRELPRTGSSADGRPLPLPDRIQSAFAARLDRLPPAARTALLIAAADAAADLGTVLRALEIAGLGAAALAAAEEAGLVQVADGRIAFTHPLLRAAAYRHTTFDRRLAAHRALAAALGETAGFEGGAPATDGAGDPDAADRRAWHLAAAATRPDEAVARALDGAAERARGRKGYAATAAALERAAELSVTEASRAGRLVAAAVAANEAGRPEQTHAVLERLPKGFATPRVYELRAKLAFDEGAAASAHEHLVAGAAAVAGTDRVAAGLMLVDAARNAWQLSDPPRVAEAAELLHKLGLRQEDGLDPAVAAVTGAARLLVDGPAAGLAEMRRMVADAHIGPPNLRLNAAFVAGLVGDFEASREIAAAVAARSRAEGAVGWLPLAHVTLAAAELYLGRFRDAVATAAEGLQLAADTGQPNRAGYLEGVLAWIAAARGDAGECVRLAERCHVRYQTNHIANGLAWAEWALALLDLGQGRAAEASERLTAALAGPVRHQIQAVYFAPDQVEAAVRAGDRATAEAACERFAEWADAARVPWADSVLQRCRALLAPGGGEALFAAAVGGGGRPWEAARTHLAYGERLRRDRRKTEARTHLRTAAELFERLGAEPWSRRARAELRAAGEQPAVSVGDAAAALSPQELQIVRLVAAGLTNREIGAQLFISPKTVSYHLYRAFPKLNVSSRTQLARLDLS
ncbi:LuxR C-terminal-related transcriptional regulator [Dactylosporangium sp. AC04546]|uniref:helix-turn-helix transcriptional regulator n=1 Tax=Dactylosporangium sp. AC04546 TaxID=2862460 RepID=UPI001EDF11E9|nr:LuxR family transcriptional regulator [Dactylosporangium sp. AC04546]WVK84271.1 LuxR C-terminal-related transcriptional regulator [Dactylosporangium sp. AC04546]